MNPAAAHPVVPEPEESAHVSAEELAKKLSEQVTKGLSQPPSRSQVPPATAAEEIIL